MKIFLPALRTAGVGEERRPPKWLQFVMSGTLFRGPAGGKLACRLDVVQYHGTVAHRGPNYVVAPAGQNPNELVQLVRLHYDLSSCHHAALRPTLQGSLWAHMPL